jgi:Holliday junction resolvase RusA-like endonuclease
MKRFQACYLGEVQAKERPRFNRKTGVAYTPRKTTLFEITLAMIAKKEVEEQGSTPIDTACAVTIIVHIAIPHSWSKKKQLEYSLRPYPVTVKPDVDNCAKSVLDALIGIFYTDDRLVAELSVKKVYSENSFVTVECVEL